MPNFEKNRFCVGTISEASLLFKENGVTLEVGERRQSQSPALALALALLSIIDERRKVELELEEPNLNFYWINL